MRGPLNEKSRTKLAAELDKDGRWFQKAARRYRARGWVRDMRRALGIGLDFLTDETQVSRKTLYLAEQREATGAIQIAELEALAQAMECKLVYAIVPERGTVAELAERRREHPRKKRSEREKEAREYEEWYAKEVERMREQDPEYQRAQEYREELRQRSEEGPEEGRREEMQWTGLDGRGPVRLIRPPGAQRIRDAVAGAMRELGPEGEQAIRKAAEKQGTREQGLGTRD